MLRCARLARKSFAIKLPVARNTILPTNRADLERRNRLVEQFGSPRPPPDHALAAVSKAVVVNFENPTVSPRRSSSKEDPHRKEKSVRGDFFPDSDLLVNHARSEADIRIKPNNDN